MDAKEMALVKKVLEKTISRKIIWQELSHKEGIRGFSSEFAGISLTARKYNFVGKPVSYGLDIHRGMGQSVRLCSENGPLKDLWQFLDGKRDEDKNSDRLIIIEKLLELLDPPNTQRKIA